jgi:hypothetical protein
MEQGVDGSGQDRRSAGVAAYQRVARPRMRVVRAQPMGCGRVGEGSGAGAVAAACGAGSISWFAAGQIGLVGWLMV